MRVRLAAYVPTDHCPSHFSPIFAPVTRCYVTPIIEQAAHRQANECFAGPQTASSATPTHPLYRIVVLFMKCGW